MINEYNLEVLLKEYGIDPLKVLKKNSNIVDYGYYFEIKNVLDYLIKELNISPTNIEKCPSVMYRNVDAVRSNYEFLKQSKVNNYDIETCLHILSTDPIELRKTYDYVLTNYGLDMLHRVTSILSVDVSRIKDIEFIFFTNNIFNKNLILSACKSNLKISEIKKVIDKCKDHKIEITSSVFMKSAEEIEKIIKVCRENKIEITGSVFNKSAEEIKKIIEVCRKNNIELTGSVFQKKAKEIEKIIEFCKKNNIELVGTVFNKSAEEIEKIIKVCRENKIEITGSVFYKSAEEIEKIIEVCRENKIEITGSVFLKKAEEIKKIIEVCRENKIEITGSVFLKSPEEIKKIIEVCRKNNIELTGSVFKQTSVEIENIIEVCKKNKIEITGSIFFKKSSKIEETIDYLITHYSNKFLISLIVIKDKKHLEKVFPYLESLGVLDVVINSSSILTLTLDEIIERKEFIESIGEDIVINNKFNSIFGMSKKNYQKRKEMVATKGK
ncbi:MAG: hypothetical protein IJ501_03720 [Bacilli bacterium]|nr:hypothetical protein [Bacilli bacterium]